MKRSWSPTCSTGDSAEVPKDRHLLWGLYWINKLRYGKNLIKIKLSYGLLNSEVKDRSSKVVIILSGGTEGTDA